MYTGRYYRTWVSRGRLCRFRIVRHESDIEIAAEYDLSIKACEALHSIRRELEDYASSHSEFLGSLSPVHVGPESPLMIRRMSAASRAWGVGPMAAVAGAVASGVGRALTRWTDTVIVENGGDIYIRSRETVNCVLFAGEGSPFTGRVGFSVDAPDGKGVCTSSGTVGHSRSFGRADAVTVIADDCAEADAAATAIANRIKDPSDLEEQLENIPGLDRIEGVIACCDGLLVSRGVRLLRMAGREEV
ncbi:MAG: UPF0280 family protein [Candidatus Fermentibacteraceae bacterium]|nr:UPF0280 family protein [Candidatus Fermentibacteraceae bacterium]MBN2608227.1 UPF0280 family protein [Candidatus Fermentibacteraceae bacterium]